jgi:hypothetical protein
MRPENKRMQDYLAENGISARVKYFSTGSGKRTWRIYSPGEKWTNELQDKLTALGFVDYNNRPLHEYSGNGGAFCVFVRGHYEMLKGA